MLEDLDYEVVGETSEDLEAIILVDECKPDILTVDLMMVSMNEFEVNPAWKYPPVR